MCVKPSDVAAMQGPLPAYTGDGSQGSFMITLEDMVSEDEGAGLSGFIQIYVARTNWFGAGSSDANSLEGYRGMIEHANRDRSAQPDATNTEQP